MSDINVYSSFDDAENKRGGRSLDRNGLSIPPNNKEVEARFGEATARMRKKDDTISDGQKDWRARFVERHRL